MKVFMLNPPYGKDFCRSARWYAKSRGRVQRHPDWMLVATAVLEKAGNQVKFLDGAALNLEIPQVRATIEEFHPDLTVIHTTTPSIYSDVDFAGLAKEVSGGRTILIGPHVTALPAEVLDLAKDKVDMVARGEYDYTLRDIAAGMPLEGVNGISYRRNGGVVHNPPRPLIEDVDELPFPAWHHIDINDYHDAGKLYPFITLITGRGCENSCTFCLFPQVMYGRRYRARSPELVVDEIEYDMRLFPNLKEVMFEDDTFTMKWHKERLHAICNEMLRRGIKISWSANARVDLNDLETLGLMKRSGCRMLCVGFEFGSQGILNNVKKGTTLEQSRTFAENCHKVGIRVHGCFMIGGPGETRETALETIRFAQELPIDTVQFSGVCPYPGTEYYRWCEGHGYLVPKDWTEWVDKNLEQRTVISLPGLSMEEINEMVDLGLKSFYLRPLQMWRMIVEMRSLSDLKAKLYGLRSFLSYFISRFKRTQASTK
jgi:radical SAM superfamily enzyme YgiQ (UPF0313 family)